MRRSSRRARRRWIPSVAAVSLCLLPLLAACGGNSARAAFSPAELRAELGRQLPPDRRGDVVVPHEVTAEMRDLADSLTAGSSSDHTKADRLVRAITDANGFGVRWERVTTTVARETYRNRIGNCLSMTALYVGLARSLNLTAYYVDASDRVNDLTREDGEELLVDTGHIAAAVRTERGWSLVDFTGEITQYRTFRRIDDKEALAHFYNNRGYEILSRASEAGVSLGASITGEDDGSDAGLWEQSLRDFTMSTFVAPDFGRALNNQGVALSRLGRDEEARAAYTRAVAADEEFAAPRHNLGNLHLRRGEYEEAAHWYRVAAKLQRKNPYLHYHLGLALYQAGDIEGSVKAFERSIALKQDYREPRNVLAQAYRQLGRLEDAEKVTRSSG